MARGITFMGGSAAFWALSALLYEETRSPAWVAAGVLAAFSVPAAVSPFAGLLGDHFDRRRIIVLSELSGALCFAALGAVGSPAALLSLRVLASTVSAPMVPATAAALPSLVPADELEHANAALSKAGTVGGLLGAVLAGVMLTTIGGPSVFLLNAVTFLLSAILILSIKGNFQPAVSQRRALGAGFLFLRRHSRLRPASVAYAVAFVGVGVSIPGEIVLATNFGVGSLGYAMLVCLWGIGAVAGAAAAERFSSSKGEVVALLGAALGLAAGFLAVSAAPLFAVALLGMAVGGAGEGLWGVTQNCLIQRVAPDGIRSRVFAGSEAVMQGAIAFGLLASGFVISMSGPRGAFAVASGAAAAAAVIFLPGFAREANLATPGGLWPARLRARTREGEPDDPTLPGGRPAPASPRPPGEALFTT
ncbi:MAG: MFS transporter [Solirubrobacterales bacterium]